MRLYANEPPPISWFQLIYANFSNFNSSSIILISRNWINSTYLTPINWRKCSCMPMSRRQSADFSAIYANFSNCMLISSSMTLYANEPAPVSWFQCNLCKFSIFYTPYTPYTPGIALLPFTIWLRWIMMIIIIFFFLLCVAV